MSSSLSNSEEWISYTRADGLIDNIVTTVAVNKNKVWFGTPTGISIFDGYNWENYLEELHITDIAIDNAGKVWVATDRGIILFDSDTKEEFLYLHGLYIQSIVIDQENVKWVGTKEGIRSTFDGTVWENYKQAESDFVSRITAILRNDSSYLKEILGNDPNLIAILGDNPNFKWARNSISSITVDKEGLIWLAAHLHFKCKGFTWILSGISSFNDTHFEFVKDSFELDILDDENQITSVAIDQKGNIWYSRRGYFGGAFKYDGKGIAKYMSQDINQDGQWIGMQAIVAILETNSTKRILSTAWAGYDVQPSGIYLYDANSGEEIWQYRTGPKPKPTSVAIGDITGDKNPEIISGGESQMNGSAANGTLDSRHDNLINVDHEHADVRRRPVRTPRRPESARTFPCKSRPSRR